MKFQKRDKDGFVIGEGKFNISQQQRKDILEITNLDIVSAIDYFDKFYTIPLSRHINLTNARLLDCACGKGWFSLSAYFAGCREIVSVDISQEELNKFKEITKILGITGRIKIILGDITHLPFRDRYFDIVASLETIEHIPQNKGVNELLRVLNNIFIVETINAFFPIDTHDTIYPLVHFLPVFIRRKINQAYGSGEPSGYISILKLERLLKNFRLLTPFKVFNNVEEWKHCFPVNNPYQGNRPINGDSKKWKLRYYYYRTLFNLLGGNSRFAFDKIHGIYQRLK